MSSPIGQECTELDRLLDTSVAILLRDAGSADSRLAALDTIPAISILTRVELEGGVYAMPALTMVRRSALDVMLGVFAVLEFDAGCADVYRDMVAAIGFSRRKVVDRMIAATAMAHRLTLVTANGRDFRDVPGLKLEEW